MGNFKRGFKDAMIELPTPNEKLLKKEIDVVDLFYSMYTARIIPLVPLQPSGGGSGNGNSCSNNPKGNLFSEKSSDPMTTSAETSVTNLKPNGSITTPTTTTLKKHGAPDTFI